MFNAALFDLDGTLVDTLGLYVRAYASTLKEFGVEYTNSDVLDNCFGKTEEEICNKLGFLERADDFKKQYFATIDSTFDNAQLFPGVIQALETANAKEIKLGVVTFAHRWYLDKMLKLLDIGKYFQTDISFNDVHKSKPNPEGINSSCFILRTPPFQTLMIGDSKSDMAMGKAAGSLTGLFTPSQNKEFYDFDELRKIDPDFEFETYDDIEELFIFRPRV